MNATEKTNRYAMKPITSATLPIGADPAFIPQPAMSTERNAAREAAEADYQAHRRGVQKMLDE